MPYYHLDQVTQVGTQVIARVHQIRFTGAMNPFLVFVAPMALAAGTAYAWKLHDRVSALALAWVAATYLPYFALAATGRVMYIFYFLATVPALAMALAGLLERLPAPVRWVYLAAYLGGFIALFPFRVMP